MGTVNISLRDLVEDDPEMMLEMKKSEKIIATGSHIRQFWDDAGLSQEDVSDRVGISVKELDEIERGAVENEASPELINLIISAAGTRCSSR